VTDLATRAALKIFHKQL